MLTLSQLYSLIRGYQLRHTALSFALAAGRFIACGAVRCFSAWCSGCFQFT